MPLWSVTAAGVRQTCAQKRQLPVVEGREERVSHPSDRSAGRAPRERGVTSPADTDGKRIEETAHRFFEAFHATPCDRRGDDRVLAAGGPMNPRVKRREQGRKKGGISLPGDPPPGVGDGNVEPEAACFTPRRCRFNVTNHPWPTDPVGDPRQLGSPKVLVRDRIEWPGQDRPDTHRSTNRR